MQFTGPINTNYPHSQKVKVVSKPTHISVSQPANPIDQQTTELTYRLRLDSGWLSHPDAILLLRKRARRAAQQQNYAAAVQIFDQLVAYEPNNAEHYGNRGLMHYNLNQYKQALSDYDYALELDPELDKAYNNRGNLYATQKNWLDAIDDYDDAIDINPLNIRARLNQAITLREMGAYSESIACLDIAMFFQADSANLYAERGRSYQIQGQWNCAIADYNRALEITQRSTAADTAEVDRINHKVLRWMNSLR